MAKPIIGGPDTSKPQAPRASKGGVTQAKPLADRGPRGPIRSGAGTNHGNKVQQGRH